MDNFLESDAARMLASWARVFVAAMIAQYLAGITDWQMLLNAGIAGVLPVVLRWLNPKDVAYGRGAHSTSSPE